MYNHVMNSDEAQVLNTSKCDKLTLHALETEVGETYMLQTRWGEAFLQQLHSEASIWDANAVLALLC